MKNIGKWIGFSACIIGAVILGINNQPRGASDLAFLAILILIFA